MCPVNGPKDSKRWQLARRRLESPNAGYLAQQLIERHEGYYRYPRPWPDGRTLIGYGADLNSRGLSEIEAGILLARDIAAIETRLCQFSWWERLSPPQQAAIIDMVYVLGIDRFLDFKQTIAHLAAGDFPAAGDAMLASAAWKAFGPRAQEDATIIALGTPIDEGESA